MALASLSFASVLNWYQRLVSAALAWQMHTLCSLMDPNKGRARVTPAEALCGVSGGQWWASPPWLHKGH